MTATFDHQVLDPAQSRLQLRTDLVVVPHDSTSFVIEDPLSGKFFLVGTAEWSFLAQLDGSCTISEAIGRSATQAGREAALTEQEGIVVARWLVDQNLAQPAGARLIARTNQRETAPAPAFNPLTIRLPPINPDAFLSAVAPFVGWVWSPWFLWGWLCAFVAAAEKLAAHAGELRSLPAQIFDAGNWLRMGLVWCLLKAVHELAHSLACKRYGVPVRRAGVLLLFGAPVAYVDVSAAWRLASRWQRIVISAAGMYVELFLAFMAIMWWTPGSLRLADRMLVDVAVMAGLHTLLFNANPLMRFDGYYILADALGVANLSSLSQKRLADVTRHWFCGVDVPRIQESKFHKLVFGGYGFLAFGWRCVAFVGIGLALIARWGWWGGAATVAVGWFWFGLPLKRRSSRPKQNLHSPAARRRQFVAIGAVAGCGLLFTAWMLSPAHVPAPAIVEYGPLTVLRAKAAGFVSKIHVHDGQRVEAGQLLVEFLNDELATELKGVEIDLGQARLRMRAYLQQSDLTKHQSEAAMVTSLEKKRDELRNQLDGLKLRSPCEATVAFRDVAGLEGRYVLQGDVVLVLGAEDKKELLVSVAAQDEQDFVAQLNQGVTVHRLYRNTLFGVGRLSQVEPRASETLPHAALGADSGGDVVVKVDRQAANEPGQLAYLALAPRVVAKVAFDAEQSREFRAGQRLTVSLPTSSQTWAGRMLARWKDYLTEVSARTDRADFAAGP